MRKLFLISSLVVLGLFSVVSCYDDSAVWDSLNEQEQRIKDLETRVDEMNTNLTSLQSLVTAMKQGDYITDVKPLKEGNVEVGYQISFYERGTITIYHGKDGASSDSVTELGVKHDTDGNYYWTLDGKWLLDENGNKLPVTSAEGKAGVTPELKIENEKWYVSYDNGKTWVELGSAVSENGSCLFENVSITDDALVLTMADGTVLSFPIGERLKISLGSFDETKIQWGTDVVIPYTIEGPVTEASVFVVSDIWMFSTEVIEETALTGKIIIRQEDYSDREIGGKVVIFATAEDGTTVSKIIRLSSGVLRPASDRYNDVFSVDAEATTLEFTVATNREVEVNTNADWITYVDTKAVEEKTLMFDIKQNDDTRRKTYVEISSGHIDFGFTVAQKGNSDGFSINVTCSDALGSRWEVNVDTLYNKGGQTIHEALGYSSWDELAAAAGDLDSIFNRNGEVVLTAYDLYTGESLYDEEYRDGLGFWHDAEGNLAYWSEGVVGWGWFTVWNEAIQNGILDKVLYFSTRNRIYAGDSYAFGIMLKAPKGEARIEVTIDVTEYVDPELGLYDTPAAPGKYEFTIKDTIDLDSLGMVQAWGVHNFEIAEAIKSTLGMTTYEVYRAAESGDLYSEFVLNDGNRVNGREGALLDVNGCWSDWNEETMVGMVSWSFAVLPENMYAYVYLPVQRYEGNVAIYWPALYRAVGHTVTYDYVIRYEDYELTFTHELTYEGENYNSDGRCLLVASTDMVESPWDSEFFITFENELAEGDLLEVSMNIKADNEVTLMSLTHAGAGNYLHWDAIGMVNFTSMWNVYTYSGYVPSEMAGGNTIAFNLNDYQYANRYFFDNVSVKVNGVEQIVNGTFDESDVVSNFIVRYDRGSNRYPAAIVNPDGDIFGVVGTHNGWSSPDNIMGEVDGMYVAYSVVLNQDDSRFKIRANNEWNEYANFGLETAAIVEPDHYYPLVCGSMAGDIKVPSGVYDIWFDFANMRVYVMNHGKSISEASEGTIDLPEVGENWYLVGSFNGWISGDPEYVMTETDSWYVYKGFTASETVEMKFNVGDWSNNLGGEFTSINEPVSVQHEGFNIVLPAGTYDIYLNKEETTVYFVTPGTVPEDYNVVEYVWSKKVVSELWDGYDAGKKVKLAKYGDYILVANGAKVGALDPKDGTLVATYDLPFEVHSFYTDDAGNIILSTDVANGDILDVYKVADLSHDPELLLSYNTANYYGVEIGNVRVKGNVNDDAVITAAVADGAGGAVIMWEVVDGVCSDWSWTSVPYTAWSVSSLCCAPAGNSLADGLFYIGYGGDYNLHYAADPVKDGASEWVTAYVTGSVWMENYNCISTLEFNGSKYAAILQGCHFNYDSSDVVVLNVDNPADASVYYTHLGDSDVDRGENYANLDWTGMGTFSDVLLLESSGKLLVTYVDSNYGVIACRPCVQ